MQYEWILNNILEYSSQSFIKFITTNIILKYNLEDVYNIRFSNSDKAYIKNVNKLIKFYLKRLSHFKKQCDKITYYNIESFSINKNRYKNISLNE